MSIKLEMTSMDRPNLRGRVKRAKQQLEKERRSLQRRIEDEGRSMNGQIVSDVGILNSNGARFFGYLGPQINPDKFNSLCGAMAAIEDCIELLDEVLLRE